MFDMCFDVCLVRVCLMCVSMCILVRVYCVFGVCLVRVHSVCLIHVCMVCVWCV